MAINQKPFKLIQKTLIITCIVLSFCFVQCKSGVEKTQENTVTEIPEMSEKPKLKEDEKIAEYIDLDFVMGKFDPKSHAYFSEIDVKYADQAGRYMHTEAYESYKKMHAAAKQEGISFTIKSAVRNFNYQKGIWERKWTGATLLEGKENAAKTYLDQKERALAILRYSSMPSSSRHHWGTDIDLNAFTNAYFESGQGKKEYEWLKKNASNYGFCQPYTPKGSSRPNGYEEEKWHWSYLPIAKQCSQVAELQLKNNMIKGFNGSEQAEKIDVVSNYILGINSRCLH